MYQFFVKKEQVQENMIAITGEDVNHISKVLRMRPGEKVRVSSDDGKSYFAIIDKILQEEVYVKIDYADENGTELTNHIVLYQGLPKADKMELIIQKAVELGVSEIVPVSMKNCIMKIDEKKAEAKTKRWQAISESAAKQSKRSIIPKVRTPISWKDAVKDASGLDITLIPYENERGMQATREIISGIQQGMSIGIMIGPEGGFSPEEIDSLKEEKMHRISLGRRILRTETAGMATLAMLVYELDK